MNLLTKQREAHRLRKQTMAAEGTGQLGRWGWSGTHVIFKMDNQQEPTI